MVEIKGIEKFASRDFPGHISSTVFLGGCNFRCPYCHNANLVLRPETLPTLHVDYFLCYLDQRKDWLEGICLSGGEPLLEPYLEELLSVIKERRLLVKLDTNASFPDRLAELIRTGLVDRVAMDVKAPLEKYREVTRSAVDPAVISRSLDVLMASGVECTFRTTVVPGCLVAVDIRTIGKMLRGAGRYQLQQFVPHNTLDGRYLEIRPYAAEDLMAMAESVRPYVREVLVEGV